MSERLFELASLGVAQGAEHVLASGHAAVVGVVVEIHDRHSFNDSSPRRIHDLTVPIGVSRRRAIWSCV